MGTSNLGAQIRQAWEKKICESKHRYFSVYQRSVQLLQEKLDTLTEFLTGFTVRQSRFCRQTDWQIQGSSTKTTSLFRQEKNYFSRIGPGRSSSYWLNANLCIKSNTEFTLQESITDSKMLARYKSGNVENIAFDALLNLH